MIETTGLADPAPVIQALMTFPVVRRFRLSSGGDDGRRGARVTTLRQHPKSVKQAAVADDIIITKTEIPGAAVRSRGGGGEGTQSRRAPASLGA